MTNQDNDFFRRSALIVAGTLMLMPASAGCISDCRDNYDSAVEDCKNQYDDPEDADELHMRLRDAKDEYDDCVHECMT